MLKIISLFGFIFLIIIIPTAFATNATLVPIISHLLFDSESSTPNITEPEALLGITDAHNSVRSAHGVGDMSWDNDLANIAQAWSDNCFWGHNSGRSDNYLGYVGENIYASSYVPSGADVTNSWASEEADYNYATNTCAQGKVCGHYTQVVWDSSIKLGCAISSCPSIEGISWGGSLVVCNYAPGGNHIGQWPY